MRQITERFRAGAANLSWAGLLPSLSAGLVIGILMIFIEISFAAMIFSGELSEFIQEGIGLMLFGLAFYTWAGVLLSSFESTHSPPQDGPVALLAVMAATIAAVFGDNGDRETLFLTVLAVIFLTTLLTGVFFYGLGRFKLGNLVRYIPFPVVGGFLAGAGWLLVTGSIGVMVDVPLGTELLEGEVLVRWLPGLVFALALFLVLQFDTPFWTLPALLIGGVAVFYLGYGLLNGEVVSAESNGWLLGPFPGGSMWHPHVPEAIEEADWGLVLGQLPDIGTVLLVALITFLLNVGALTVAAEQDIDMNHELRVYGIVNILGSFGGFTVGYTSVSISALAYRLAKGSRLVNAIVGAMAAMAVLIGASFLNFFPRIVAGGFLLFIGLTFIQDWLISARSKVPRQEYILMWVIVLLVVLVGFLEAVFAGILISTILFAINYSRTPLTRLAVTAESFQSQVQRPLLYQQLLKQRGNKLHILSLQGYIFFGVGDSLLEDLKKRIETAEPEFVVLDFRLVSGIDSSAMLSLSKIKQLAAAKKTQLVLTGLGPELEGRLRREAFGAVDGDYWRVFPELEVGVAWCEEQLIERWESVGLISKPEPIRRQWLKLVREEDKEEEDYLAALLEEQSGRRKSGQVDEGGLGRLDAYLERRDVAVGETIVEEMERFDGLILVESGQVMVRLANMDGSIIRVKIMDAGNIVGELGQYARRNVRVAVVATEAAVVFLVTGRMIRRMEREDPPLALALHRLAAALLSERNLQLDKMAEALLF